MDIFLYRYYPSYVYFDSLDRYFCIFRPFRYDVRKHQIGLAISVVISSWCVCLIICLLSIITWNYRPADVLTYLADTSFVALSLWVHLKIFLRARRTQRETATETGHFEGNNTKSRNRSKINSARITAIMFFGIILCYAPQLITGIFLKSLHYSRSSLIAYFWTDGLILFNSVVNPLLYIWQMKWSRNALWKVTSEGKVSVVNITTASE